MSDTDRPKPETEAVAAFTDRAHLHDAVERLLAKGFERTDLSVLASHDSLEVAGGEAGYEPSPAKHLDRGLIGELVYLGPLTVAGLILLASGPVGVALAGIIGAGIGGLALTQVMDELIATTHTTAFAAALERGEILLWVRVGDAGRRALAVDILTVTGGRHVHLVERPRPEPA